MLTVSSLSTVRIARAAEVVLYFKYFCYKRVVVYLPSRSYVVSYVFFVTPRKPPCARNVASTVRARCARSTLSAFCGYVRERLARVAKVSPNIVTKVISKKTRVSSFPFKTVCDLSVNVSMNVPAVGRAPVQPARATRRGCAVRPITMGDGRTRGSIQDARGPRPGSGLGASVARPRAPRAAPHRRRESALSSNACRAARHLATLPRLKNCLFGNSRAKRRGSTRKKHGKKSNRVRF